MSVHAHVIMWQENTGSQVTRSQAKQKDKRNNKKLLTNRKQCYIIQSSTRDKRNKKRETQLQNKKNGGSKNEKVVKCRIKQRGK